MPDQQERLLYVHLFHPPKLDQLPSYVEIQRGSGQRWHSLLKAFKPHPQPEYIHILCPCVPPREGTNVACSQIILGLAGEGTWMALLTSPPLHDCLHCKSVSNNEGIINQASRTELKGCIFSLLSLAAFLQMICCSWSYMKEKGEEEGRLESHKIFPSFSYINFILPLERMVAYQVIYAWNNFFKNNCSSQRRDPVSPPPSIACIIYFM